MANWPATGDTDWNAKMLAYLAISLNTDGTPKASVFGFGTRTGTDSGSNTLVKTEVYKVGSDGYVSLVLVGSGMYTLYNDGSNPPATRQISCYSGLNTRGEGFVFPVKKDSYWRITEDVAASTSYVIKWIPIGTGTCVKQ